MFYIRHLDGHLWLVGDIDRGVLPQAVLTLMLVNKVLQVKPHPPAIYLYCTKCAKLNSEDLWM